MKGSIESLPTEIRISRIMRILITKRPFLGSIFLSRMAPLRVAFGAIALLSLLFLLAEMAQLTLTTSTSGSRTFDAFFREARTRMIFLKSVLVEAKYFKFI